MNRNTLDPLQAARDFTRNPHPRRQFLGLAQRVAAVERRASRLTATAGDASNTDPGVVAITDVLPEPDPDGGDIGRVVVVSATAGQPGGVYVGDQDAFGIPVWRPMSATTDPLRFSYERSFGATGSGAGQFNRPRGVAVNESRVWVSDNENGRIQAFDYLGNHLATHGPSATMADFPSRIAWDAVNRRVGVVGRDSVPTMDGFQVWPEDFSARVFQTGSSGSGNGQFSNAQDIAADPSGNWLVVDGSNNRVQKFDAAGAYVSQFGTLGAGDGQFNLPTGICVDRDGNIHVADPSNYRVQKFSPSFAHLLTYGGRGNGPGQFSGFPSRVAPTDVGAVAVSDGIAGLVSLFSLDGEFITRFGRDETLGFSTFSAADHTAFYGDMLWLVDAGNNQVHIWRMSGGVPELAGIGGVDLSSGPVDREVLMFDQTSRTWKNDTLAITPVITQRSNSVSVGNTSTGTVTATCNADEVCISCGAAFGAGPARWIGDAYVTPANGCYVSARNNGTAGAVMLTAHAMCMKVPLS